MKFNESELAHKYCLGEGLEIGGAAHNPFGLNTKNVDYSNDFTTTFKKQEIELCGEALQVDIVASGDNIPVGDNSHDFVVSSHVIEHFQDPIKALLEWYRIVKKGGVIFTICPHKERTFDSVKPRTTLQELVNRYKNGITAEDIHDHYTVWVTEDMVELVEYMNKKKLWKVKVEEIQDVDDKVGNGFTVVLRKK